MHDPQGAAPVLQAIPQLATPGSTQAPADIPDPPGSAHAQGGHEAAAGKTEDAVTLYMRVSRFLAHPMVLALVGALVTSLLLPIVTRQWQDHQTELDIKTKLVNQISGSVATALAQLAVTESGQSARLPIPFQDYYDAYQVWEQSRASIRSQLEAYFPNSDVGEQWQTYSGEVDNFYKFTGRYTDSSNARRLSLLAALKSYLDDNGVTPTSWKKLMDTISPNINDQDYQGAWGELRDAISNRGDTIVRRVVKSHIPEY